VNDNRIEIAMLYINKFRTEDFDFVANLYATENWGYLPSDIRRFMEWEPDGCFIAEIDGKYVGHVFSISYGHLGWIGLLRVDPKHRNRGIGSELTRKAISYLRSKGAKTVKLEAVQEAVNLYRRLGFKEEFDSLRLKALVQIVPLIEYTSILTPSARVEIRPMNNEDIPSIAVLDSIYFGASRIKVLNTLFQDFPHLCFVAVARDRLLGYAMCRKSASGIYRIAPWVCDPESPKVAEKLLVACLRSVGENSIAMLGIPAVNDQAVEIAKKFGFQIVDVCRRMYIRQEIVKDNTKGIFAIGGSEKG
jgi:ribosomal protein S18 acetylase RimI-like enzyme